MTAPTFAKAVVGVQTMIVHLATATGALAHRALWRPAQKVIIQAVRASQRVANATSCQVMVENAGVNILSAAIETITVVAAGAAVLADYAVAGLVELGTHSYKVTFVTAAGETVAGTKSNVVTLAAPTAPAAALVAEAGNITAGDHSYKVTNTNAAGESVGSAKSNVVTADAGHGKVTVTIAAGPAGTTSRKVYRTETGDAGAYKLVGTVADNVTLILDDNVADGALGAVMPAAAGSQIAVSGIPIGGTGVTSRKLYRTVAGDGGNHLLVATIANNVATTYLDAIADGALGAAAPTANTASDGVVADGTLDPDHVAVPAEADVTVDVDQLTGTSVSDLTVEIDYTPVQ